MTNTDQNPAHKKILESFSPTFSDALENLPSPSQEAFFKLVEATQIAGLDWWQIKQGKTHYARCGRFKKMDGDPEKTTFFLYNANIGNVWTTTSSTGIEFGELGRIPKTPLDKLIHRLIEVLEKGDLAAIHPRLKPRINNRAFLPKDIWPDLSAQEDEEDDERTGNWIYYGPPGTGKTFKLSELLKEYTDAVAGSNADEKRRRFILQEITQRTWWEAAAAALYDLGGKANVPQLATHPYIQAIAAHKGSSKNIKPILWSNLQLHALAASKTVKHHARAGALIFDKDADSTWVLQDGWKEQCPDLAELLESKEGKTTPIQRYAFVTFHQSYGYEEFVEGLRPVLDEANAGSGDVQYEIRAGVFKQLCARARLDPDHRYAMVIDEINRGNISKIFGELITLIEDDKREGKKTEISVTLPYSGESFSVPANVDIIGTMNTADRSLALLDTALRRRFEFEPMLPKPELLAEIKIESNGKTIEVQKLLAKMNERIELLYDRDHCIGHAYFFPLKEDNSLEKLGTIFQKQILPLLEEYFFEDWEKIRLVLGDKQKAKEHQFITETKTDNDALIKLFGSGHGLDAESQPARYAINADAFGKVESYLGIYQASKQAAKENQAETSADNTNGE